MDAAKDPGIPAVVLFYGFYMPDFSQNRPRIQGHFAENDEWQPVSNIRKADQALKDAGMDASMYIYAGASHWFMEEDRPEYDPKSAALAWQRTLAFLRENAAV